MKELYANVVVEEEEIKCWVRGKRFSVSPAYLVEILNINRLLLPIPSVYDELTTDEETFWEALGANLEFSSNRKSISVASLSPELRLLSMIMCNNLYPLSSTGYISLGRALLLHDLISDVEIDVFSYFSHCGKNGWPDCFKELYSILSPYLMNSETQGVHPSEDERPYPRPSPINIRTLHASMGHTKKNTKQESHASKGSSSFTSHAYGEQLDNIMATLQEVTTKIFGLATIMQFQHIRFETKFTSLQTQMDQIQRKLEEHDD